MKYCSKCGTQLVDEAVVCTKCGCAVAPIYRTAPTPASEDDTLDLIIKIFMIIGCVSLGWLLIPLAWCIPMTVTVFNKLKTKEPMSTGFKICVLIFVNLIAGIILLVRDE